MYLSPSDLKYVFATFRTAHKELKDDEASRLYERACDLLGNLAHYYHGRGHEAEDVVIVMTALYKEKNP